MRLQVVLAGVGGQGVLFASRLIYELAQRRGEAVIGSETHGMSQRGGSVVSHLKIGNFYGPLIGKGRADLLLALQREEGLRSLPMLKEGGEAVINAPSLPSIEGVKVYPVDAGAIASGEGNPKGVNLVIVGYALGKGFLPYTLEEAKAVIASLSPPYLLEANLRALKGGFSQGCSD